MTELAIFVATSGHSGVDRVIGNLVTGLERLGIATDLLQIEHHGPHLELDGWQHVRRVPLGTRHVNTALPGLVRYLRRERPSVLLADKYRVNRLAILARRLAGVPTRLALRIGTTVSQGLRHRGAGTRALETWTFRHFYGGVEAVLAPSQGAARDLERLAGWPPGRVRTVPSPVLDAERLAAQPPPQHPWFRPGAPPVVLGVGELSPRKDFETLLRGFARLRAGRSCRLLILGRGGRRDALLTLAAELGVADDVELPGFVADPYPYMAHAAAFALTSRWEGMPVVLIEALALGTPVLAADCPSGPSEILGGGTLGPLVPVGDARAVAAGLTQLLDQPPDPALLRAAAGPYEILSSTRAYLQAMGLASAEPTSAA